jgi:hypothetical protein
MERAMITQTVSQAGQPSANYGIWLLVVAAAIGLVLSLIAYFTPHGPIAQSAGALLVIISTALMAGAALLIGFVTMPRWLVILFEVLIILDIAGTGVCAYFLEAYVLLALMVIALSGWILQPFTDTRHPAEIGS